MVNSNTLMNYKIKISYPTGAWPYTNYTRIIFSLPELKADGPLVVYIVSFYYKNLRVMAHNYNDIIKIKSKTHKIK